MHIQRLTVRKRQRERKNEKDIHVCIAIDYERKRQDERNNEKDIPVYIEIDFERKRYYKFIQKQPRLEPGTCQYIHIRLS